MTKLILKYKTINSTVEEIVNRHLHACYLYSLTVVGGSSKTHRSLESINSEGEASDHCKENIERNLKT